MPNRRHSEKAIGYASLLPLPLLHYSPKRFFLSKNDEKDEYWLNEVKRLSPDHTYLKANDGESGLCFCRKQNIDCIVLDLDLPGMSGFETLLNLKADLVFDSIPIVLSLASIVPFPSVCQKNIGVSQIFG